MSRIDELRAMKFSIPTRRRWRITWGGIAILAIVLCVYASVFCIRNTIVRSRWDAWTAHLVGPPSWWTQPSHELERFEDSSSSVTTPSGWTTSLWGYKDWSGNVVIPARFTSCAENFYDGVAWANDPLDQKSGYINPDGSWRIVLEGHTANSFVGGMGEFWVWEDPETQRTQRYGFVNLDGEVVVPPTYRTVEWYVDGYVLVEEQTLIGSWMDHLFGGVYGIPGTPFDTKAIILDKQGKRAKLPRR